jgi:hypothetical protein
MIAGVTHRIEAETENFDFNNLDHALFKCNPVDLTIKMHEGAGFFAELHKVMLALIHYEERGFSRVYVDWTDEFFPYKDSAHENGWNLFFEPINSTLIAKNANVDTITITSGSFHEIHDQVCTAPWVAYKKYLPYRQFVHKKLNKYIKIKPHILAKCNQFYDQHMRGKICIGVHARIARAHAWLMPGKKLPILDDYYKEIDTLLEKHAYQELVIFVASDSHDAVDQFKKRYKEQITYIDAYRAHGDHDPCIMYTMGEYMRNNPEVWHKQKHRYLGGESTLLDCLLLAKCDYLIFTTSNLAFFSCYYNPDIEGIYLPKAVPFKACRYKDNPEIKNKALNPV